MAKRGSKKSSGLDLGFSLRPEYLGILLLLLALLTVLTLIPVERGAADGVVDRPAANGRRLGRIPDAHRLWRRGPVVDLCRRWAGT